MDKPDYVQTITVYHEGGFAGLEELATRLGFIGPYNLQGNIVLMEDFESELTEWLAACDALGSTATRSSRHKFSGDWSVKLYNVGSVNAIASIYRYIHFPGSVKCAVFCRFCWDSSCDKVVLAIDLYNGTNEYYPEVYYDLPTTTLAVLTTGDTYFEVSTALSLSPGGYTWFPFLLIFDLETGYYDKLYVGDTEYDISSVPLCSSAEGFDPSGFVKAQAKMGDAAAFTVYVDDIIIAKNVP